VSWDRCPWCRAMLDDLWDFEWGSREELRSECGHCGKDIVISRIVEVDYKVTKPTQPESDE
jgi:hypothetical protein